MPRFLRGGLLAILLTGLAAPASASDLTGSACVGFRAGPALFVGGLDPGRFVTKLDKDGNPVSVAVDQKVAPRLAGDLAFSYIYSDHMTLDVYTSWAWSRITSGSEAQQDSFYVATSVPILVGVRYLARDGKPWRPYLGAGGGLYWWSVLSRDLGAAKDPQTYERLRRGSLGLYGTAGVEKRFSKYITGTADLAYHRIFSENTEDFPSGFNGNKAYVQARVGINFFFSVSERIETGFPE